MRDLPRMPVKAYTDTNTTVPTKMIVALDDVSRWYDRYIPVAADPAPITGEINSIRENELVIMRAIDAGITRSAEINRVPITRIVTRIVNDRSAINYASIHATRTPDVWATSGSNVA